MIVAVALGLLCTVDPPTGRASAVGAHGSGCTCPEDLPGWVVYPDSARMPDFFQKSSVQIREIVLCERGVHLLFHTEQAWKVRDVCLVIGEPTLEQSLRRLPADSVPSDADFEQIVARWEWDRGVFEERMKKLRNILRWPSNGDHRVSFKTGWLRKAPRLYPDVPINLRYDGRSVELFGVPEVYFREE